MFIGSVDAGYRAADLMTLVSSAVRNDLDVFAYFKDVLDRLLAGDTDYNALTSGSNRTPKRYGPIGSRSVWLVPMPK